MGEDRLALSLNETETLAAKAARGAGLGWGQAEDIGRAARWLAAREIGWAEPLLALLDDEAGRQALARTLDLADRIAAAKAGERWAAPACPWLWTLPAVSAALYDRPIAVTLTDRPDILGESVSTVPPAAREGRGAAAPSVRLGPDGAASGSLPAVTDLAPRGIMVEIRESDADEPSGHVIAARTRRSLLPPALYRALEAWAARTTVPASAASRRHGAGGARLDDE